VGVNPHGSTEKVTLLLNDSHLEPQAVRPPHHHGDDDMVQQKHRFQRNIKPPYLTRQMSKWFYDTFTGATIGASHCGSFVREGFGLLVATYG
jgi:hypothetical protein